MGNVEARLTILRTPTITAPIFKDDSEPQYETIEEWFSRKDVLYNTPGSEAQDTPNPGVGCDSKDLMVSSIGGGY